MIHKNSEGLPLYLFDRSRLNDAAHCPRLYYWRYGFMGVGIVKARDLNPYWPFITGSFIHEGIEAILLGANGKQAAETASSNYYNQYISIINDPEIGPERQAILQLELAQEVDLVKALVYGWSLVGYPRLLANYDLVEGGIEQEEEISWTLEEPVTVSHPTITSQVEMKLMTRTDILARSKSSSLAMLINLKSVGNPNEKWRLSFNRDMQTLTEAIAVESRLGMKVDGIIIEGLVKGSNKEYPKGSGFWQSDSMLIYAWVKDNTSASLPGESGGIEYATSWDYTCDRPHVMGNNARCPGGRNHTLGKGFRKRPVRDCFNGGVYGWVDYLMRHDSSTLESYFLQLPPISRDEFQIERWKRQHLHSEKSRQDNAAIIDAKFIEGDKDAAYRLLDHHFIQHTGYQCHSCAYEDLCWSTGDPMDEGKWRARTPNHLLEAEKLVEISNAI